MTWNDHTSNDAGAASSFTLRGYQTEAIASVEASFAAGNQRVGIVLPTGGGKTVVFSAFAARQKTKTLVLAHRDELIEQAAAKMKATAPHLRVGVVKAERDEHAGMDVVVASVQTLAQLHRRAAITDIGLVIVDEAHHAVAPTYRAVLEHFGCFTYGGARALGVTATMARSDKEALGDIWQEISYRLDILDLIEHDPPHLSDVRGIRVKVPGMDLRKVKTTGGDFRTGELADAMDEGGAWVAAADAYMQYAKDRRGIVFTPTVASAHHVAAELTQRGIVAEAVDGTTHIDERRAILARFEAGATQVVSNCGVLTEGYDAPWVSAVLLARPTKSETLYVQMAGRGLRTFPGKDDCLVIDIVGTTEGKKLATLACLTGKDVADFGDGESLREAHERHAIESTTAAPYLGDLSASEISLFGGSAVIWPEWHGVRYIDISNNKQTVYLSPSPAKKGTFDVVVRTRTTGTDVVVREAKSFLSALRSAELYATDQGGNLVARGASWRYSRAASDKQLAMLRRIGFGPTPGITSGQASELISVTTVHRDFTRHAPRGYQHAGSAA